jgi:MFS family permease
MKGAPYRNYLLCLLLIIYAFSAVDRLALGLVLQDIKADLHLSDSQLGFLTGIAFALFYSIMGIPIARWADRGNRVTILSLTVALLSVMVALCGAVASFVQLLLIRIGAAVGEAGCAPSANSLIADYFVRAERPRAVAIYMLGGALSGLIGYFLAGWLNEFYGWRAMFMMLGLPGLGLASLTWFSLREPRTEKITAAAPSSAELSLKEVCATLWANRTFRHLLICFSIVCFFGYGIGQWQAAFFIRTYGIKTGELGTWLAAICGIGGMAGTYLGGEWASRRAANNERLQFKAMAIVCCGLGAISALIYLASNHYVAFGLMGLLAVGGASIGGPQFAAIQTLVPERMRATSIALIYLAANLIGMGLGPLAVGLLSDALRPWAGEQSLRYSLLALCPGYLLGGWQLWQASRTVTQDLAAVHVGPGDQGFS